MVERRHSVTQIVVECTHNLEQAVMMHVGVVQRTRHHVQWFVGGGNPLHEQVAFHWEVVHKAAAVQVVVVADTTNQVAVDMEADMDKEVAAATNDQLVAASADRVPAATDDQVANRHVSVAALQQEPQSEAIR